MQPEKKGPRDWAPAKVRLLVPNRPDKKTLVAIAEFADPNGENAWPSIKSIATRSCQSERTVQRHIRTLCRDGLLVENRGGGYKHSSSFWIPICKMSDLQWEEFRQCSKRQIKLPFPTERGDMVSREGCHLVAERGDMVSPNLPVLTNLKTRSGDTEILKVALRAKLSASHDSKSVAILEDPSEPNPIASGGSNVEQLSEGIGNFAVSMSAETKAVWDALLVKLSVEDAPVGIGQHARTAIYGTNAVNPDTEGDPVPIVQPAAL